MATNMEDDIYGHDMASGKVMVDLEEVKAGFLNGLSAYVDSAHSMNPPVPRTTVDWQLKNFFHFFNAVKYCGLSRGSANANQ
ncbi:hypothetical protein LZ31DRAFT_555851 [Colletotrichum somersetense]|nr:hypothetical protein LZ31DRAFT_555851 [Colletotrichum somersetense]